MSVVFSVSHYYECTELGKDFSSTLFFSFCIKTWLHSAKNRFLVADQSNPLQLHPFLQ